MMDKKEEILDEKKYQENSITYRCPFCGELFTFHNYSPTAIKFMLRYGTPSMAISKKDHDCPNMKTEYTHIIASMVSCNIIVE